MILISLLFAVVLLMFFIGPVWYQGSKHSVAQSEENLRLYQERKQDLAQSELDEQSKAALELELDREFLAAQTELEAAQSQTPMAKRYAVPVILLCFTLGSALLFYQHWGASTELKATKLLNTAQQRELTSQEQEQLFASIKAAAQKQQKNFEWAYIYAQLNLEKGQYPQAAEALTELLFALPVEAEQDRAAIMLQLAQAKLYINNQEPTEEIYGLLNDALSLSPEQFQARSLAGMMAFQLGKYADTIKHWREIWLQLPPGDNADILETGIRRAAEQLAAQGESADLSFFERKVLTLMVDVTPEAKKGLAANTTVFVAARAVQGPPMPLAAQRLTLADLPAEVVLSDAQALAPGMSLSDFAKVSVRATLSVSGEPSAQAGDWQSQALEVANDHREVIQLTIDHRL